MIDPGLNFFGHSVDAETRIDDLKEFLSVAEGFISESMATQRHSLCDEDEYLFAGSFQTILCSSVIISCIIFLEQEVRSFANVLKMAAGLELALRDLSGSWLERFFKYCEKVANLDLRVSPELRNDIQGILEIRNCLVHADG